MLEATPAAGPPSVGNLRNRNRTILLGANLKVDFFTSGSLGTHSFYLLKKKLTDNPGLSLENR